METLEIISDYELKRGKPMPSLNHSILQSNLIFELKLGYRQTHTIASELSLDMSEKPDTVPDICIFPLMEIDFLHDQTSVSFMPLGIIEIVSPSQSNDEILSKFERYFAVGILSCWLVIPVLRNIYVFSNPTDYEIFKSDEVLTDTNLNISINLKEIFR